MAQAAVIALGLFAVEEESQPLGMVQFAAPKAMAALPPPGSTPSNNFWLSSTNGPGSIFASGFWT